MVSINTERCNSHLQETANLFSHTSKSISNHTFVSNSFSNLSIKFLDVTCFPSLHANGESFTKKSIVKVGSSTLIASNGSTHSTQTVSHTKISGIPAIVTISPHLASLDSTLVNHNVVYNFDIFHFL